MTMFKRTFLMSIAPGAGQGQDGAIDAAHGVERLPLTDSIALYVPAYAAGKATQVAEKALGSAPLQNAAPGAVRQQFIEAWSRTAFGESYYSPALLVLPDEVLMARHPLGIEAVWYGLDPDGTLCVGSSLRELAGRIGPSARARPLGVIDWAHHGFVTAPGSPLEGVYAVRQDQVISWDRATGKFSESPSWHVCELLDASLREELARLSTAELDSRVEREIEQAVVQTVGDSKTVGALVSGGVDSSLMAAFIKRHAELRAVTVALPGYPQYDEAKFAREAGKALGVDIFEFEATRENFREALPYFVDAQCSPVIVENAVALFACARSGAFEGCDIILDGECADTSHFGMLGTCKWSANAFALQNSFGPLGKVLTALLERLSNPFTRMEVVKPRPGKRAGLATLLSAREMDCWDFLLEIEEKIEGLHKSDYERDLIATTLFVLHEKSNYLWHFDVVGMELNRQIRFPFMELNNLKVPLNTGTERHIVWDLRSNRLSAKSILKRLAVKRFPHSLIYRPKTGFSVPGTAWLPEWPKEWVADSWAAQSFGLSKPGLERFLREQRAHRDFFFLTTIEMFGRLYGHRVGFDTLNEEWIEACGASR